MFGVQLCAEGHVPDFPSLRLQQVPVLPAIGQTEVRVSMAPATDNPSSIQWNTRQEKNDNKGQYLATPETSRRLSTSVQRFDSWDRLGNQREL